ncbi:MAG: hypothetical protein J0L81_13125 [Caulobacterales bacterium]|jgi:hypothetical protein|nr:hypothetical protein [Caulobacterales bacterium]
MLLRKLVVVGLVGFVSFAANIATAEDAVGPNATFVDGVSFADPSEAFSDRFSFDLREGDGSRFTNISPTPSRPNDPEYRRYELALVARASNGIDVSFNQRGGFGFNEQGDIERQSRASELRLGRGLGLREDDDPASSEPSWYIFAASEDEALTWRPGTRSEFGGSGSSFALQERVEIGDLQAGITYEANGWQASLAYVEREISVRNGSRTISQDEDFTGFTLTMRH